MPVGVCVSPLTKKLVKAGIIPAQCSQWRLTGTATGARVAESKCYVEEEALEAIVNAVIEEKAELVRRAILTNYEETVKTGPIEY